MNTNFTLDKMFMAYARTGAAASRDGTTINLEQIEHWMRQARITPGTKITPKDINRVFRKYKSPTITFDNFLKMVDDLAKERKLSPETLRTRLLETMPQMSPTPTSEDVKIETAVATRTESTDGEDVAAASERTNSAIMGGVTTITAIYATESTSDETNTEPNPGP